MFEASLSAIVHTEASGNVGLDAIQQQKQGQEIRTVAFASRTLSSAKRKHSTGEGESFA